MHSVQAFLLLHSYLLGSLYKETETFLYMTTAEKLLQQRWKDLALPTMEGW